MVGFSALDGTERISMYLGLGEDTVLPFAALAGRSTPWAGARSRAPSCAGCWRPWTATPAVARIRAAATATSGFGLASQVISITPSARAVTAAGTAPAAGGTIR